MLRRRATPSLALWAASFALVGIAIVVRNLTDLSRVPPGSYIDESSIAYNAWTVAHYGVDEHGFHLPLYFQAFGEYKNPLYIYALVPFVRFLAVTSDVERLPAAIFGLVVALFLTLTAWRITRSLASKSAHSTSRPGSGTASIRMRKVGMVRRFYSTLATALPKLFDCLPHHGGPFIAGGGAFEEGPGARQCLSLACLDGYLEPCAFHIDQSIVEAQVGSREAGSMRAKSTLTFRSAG